MTIKSKFNVIALEKKLPLDVLNPTVGKKKNTVNSTYKCYGIVISGVVRPHKKFF